MERTKPGGNITLRMQIVITLTTLAAALCVYAVVFFLGYNALLEDIRHRANSVRGYVENTITTGKFTSDNYENWEQTQERLSQLREIANISRLYTAKLDENGEVVFLMNGASDTEHGAYAPLSEIQEDLRQCLIEGRIIRHDRVIYTELGVVHAIYWPVFDRYETVIGAVGLEFDVTSIYTAYRQSGIYSLLALTGIILIFSVIASLLLKKMSEPFYKKLAYKDYLTGYENRLAFEHRLRECGQIADSGERVTLMIFDLNGLKAVNDAYGHEIGDVYIKNTADIISEHLQGLGEFYRIGGDEFAAITIGTAEKKVQVVITALRKEKRLAYKNIVFSCASGCATFTKGTDKSMRDVFKRADDAMYEDKKLASGTAKKAVSESGCIRECKGDISLCRITQT